MFKKYSIDLSNNARGHLSQIKYYISVTRNEPLNATKVLQALIDKIDIIPKNPFAYSECTQLKTKGKIYRKAVCKNYLIIFRLKYDEILILGILHGAVSGARIKELRKAQR